ncbi:MAG: Ig-like domain-containing protein [Bacillota bacterium]|nr:Ig-like domain-containing protein [Bacillota bacterium]
MAISTVKATINGQTYDLSYNSTSGKYEKTVTAPAVTSYNVNAGHYYPVQIQATDDAGNTVTKDDTDATLGVNLKLNVKETVKPTITITSPSAGAKLTTSTPTISFQLRDEANGSGIKIASLALKIDGGTAVGNAAPGMTCTQTTNGLDCAYVCQTALAEGNHTITADIQDNDGNAADAASATFTVDTVPPTLNVSNPADGIKTNNASLTVSGTTNDVTSNPVTVTIRLNGADQGTVAVTSGNFSKAVTLAQGENTIVVRSTDGAGKYSEVTRTVTLDTTPPTISAVTITPNPVSGGATFTITVTVRD